MQNINKTCWKCICFNLINPLPQTGICCHLTQVVGPVLTANYKTQLSLWLSAPHYLRSAVTFQPTGDILQISAPELEGAKFRSELFFFVSSWECKFYWPIITHKERYWTWKKLQGWDFDCWPLIPCHAIKINTYRLVFRTWKQIFQ